MEDFELPFEVSKNLKGQQDVRRQSHNKLLKISNTFTTRM